jgi:hypothetical protein
MRFEQRECVIVPQTGTRAALHADVHFEAISHEAHVIEDAYLIWRVARAREPFRRSHWDRAVVDGHFRYPPQPLAVAVGAEPVDVTLTFTDALIPHNEPPMPEASLLLELAIAGEAKPLQRELWRVAIASWQRPAEVTWLGPKHPPKR